MIDFVSSSKIFFVRKCFECHLREVLICMFILKKYGAEAYRLLVEAYSKAVLCERSCGEWLYKFKNGEYHNEVKKRSGRPKVYEHTE